MGGALLVVAGLIHNAESRLYEGIYHGAIALLLTANFGAANVSCIKCD